MTRILLVMFLMAFGGVPAYAANAPAQPQQAAHQDKKAIQQAYQTLDSDSEEIRVLDKQRDDALRSNNPAAAKKIQAVIDQKRAALKKAQSALRKDETDLQRQQRLEAQQCAKDPACANKKKREMLLGQLANIQKKLAFDKAAAANIPKDEEAIGKIEAALK